MDDATFPAPLSADAAAQLLGYSPGELERLRRERKIHGEPFRRRWWQIFPEYRYSERAILDYVSSDEVFYPDKSPPLVRIANGIITGAVDEAASDIHVEPDWRNLRIRYRINGTLHEIMAIPKHIAGPLTHRYLLIARAPNPLSLAIPQSGVIKIRCHNRLYDIRLSSVPNRHGAKIVMRFVASPAPTRWEELGMAPAQAAQAADMLRTGVPGLTVFAAPQGEGLTTAFRCALYNANRPESNIYFLDDIADFPVAGLTRVLIDPANGMTAEAAVRSARRQGATLIVFGEISDRGTAQVAVEAAESGLPVWAGLRVPKFAMNATPRNSARILWTRFQGFGIAPERLEPILRGAVMFRLIRTLCPHCKEETLVSEQEAFEMETHGITVPPFSYRAKGCELCRKTGYRARTGLFAIHSNSALGYDRSPFAQNALFLFARGETDTAELRRMCVLPRY